MSDATVAGLARGDNSATVGWRREQKLTIVLLSIAALARIPFWWRGFGGHPDEWLVIRSGLDFWLHGAYFPSRPAPAFPFDEILMGGLAWLGGSTACAAAATVASLVALLYMRGLAVLHGIQNWFWMLIAFSFEPWVWSSGTHALDYIWGTAALVAAAYYVESRRFGPAGLACAIGFGFRPSSLLWIGPLFIRVIVVRRGWQDLVRFVLWTALPSLIPLGFIVWVIVAHPGTYAHVETEFNLIPSTLLAGFHFIELMGHLPAIVIIVAACFACRDRIRSLFRGREGWVWNYLLIFVSLLFQFWIESGKPEYMLPALPGIFMILGRCLSDNWWKAITAAFIFNAFVSFGVGHASHIGHVAHIASIEPSLRKGALMWYEGRGEEANEQVLRAAAELSRPARIVRVDDDLDRYYVSSLLRRGPPRQARISCPLVPATTSFASGLVTIEPSAGLPNPPGTSRMLVCCRSSSAIVLANTPADPERDLKERVRAVCTSAQAASRPGAVER